MSCVVFKHYLEKQWGFCVYLANNILKLYILNSLLTSRKCLVHFKWVKWTLAAIFHGFLGIN